MHLALIGATGRTGVHALTSALDGGHEVTVLVRDPARLPDEVSSGVRVVVGDAADPAALTEALGGADAVVSALGPVRGQPDVHTRTAIVLVFAAPAPDWPRVRPPRLVDGPRTPGQLEHDATRSTRSTRLTRADLGAFLIEVAVDGSYPRCAPFVATPAR